VTVSALFLSALIDRVVHHAEIIAIEGDSYRRREAETGKSSRRLEPQGVIRPVQIPAVSRDR
jgi:hypothetical protein